MRGLEAAIGDAERSITAWHRSETRLAGKIIRITYAMFNWTGAYRKLRNLVATSDERAEAFLLKGLERWQKEGRISASDADATRRYLSDSEVHEGLRHLGAHLAITAMFLFPFGSILRPAWTLSFCLIELSLRLWPGARYRRGSLLLHGPRVLVRSILPRVGGVAYVSAGPPRERWRRLLAGDRLARKFHLGSRFAPRPIGNSTPAGDDSVIPGVVSEAIPGAIWTGNADARPVRPALFPVPELAAARATSPGSPFLGFPRHVRAALGPLPRRVACRGYRRIEGRDGNRACSVRGGRLAR